MLFLSFLDKKHGGIIAQGDYDCHQPRHQNWQDKANKPARTDQVITISRTIVAYLKKISVSDNPQKETCIPLFRLIRALT